jgi:hypothetical protein
MMTIEEASLALSTWLLQMPAEAAAQETALEHYGKFFHRGNPGNNNTQGDFRVFFAFKNNGHWANIQRHPNGTPTRIG